MDSDTTFTNHELATEFTIRKRKGWIEIRYFLTKSNPPEIMGIFPKDALRLAKALEAVADE